MIASTVINLNNISKQFANKYYNNNEEDILYDIYEFTKNLRELDNIDDYQAFKAYKAIISYCGIKNIDLNKFIKLRVE